MQVFIAGIMQADRADRLIESQTYREQIGAALRRHVADVQIVDPWLLNPNSVEYEDEQARQTFFSLTRRAREADLLIAYLPKPSMGTAMEMWEAYHGGAYIVAVTPFRHHWAVRFVANEILPDIETLLVAIENGRLPHIVAQYRAVDAPSQAD
ncbi:MAG: hypothetical protein KC425_04715 [Anaerolineales bacterium]|nr:hypothetical protein [Anaerolineales bacterium]